MTTINSLVSHHEEAEVDNDTSNSFQNFVSSYRRAQSFGSNELAPLQGTLPSTLQDEVIDEETNLLQPELNNRRDSIKSIRTLLNKHSTVYQTVFNAVNTLIGIALLSLPYALQQTGIWLGGGALFASYLLTSETAKILGQIIHKHPHLTTYSSIAGYCGGKRFQWLITVIFVIDISGASLLLTLLFSDTFGDLLQLPKGLFKVLIISVAFVLSLLPLSILSSISLIGVLCTFSLLLLIVSGGLLTSVQPGSLLSPMPMPMYPTSLVGVVKVLGMFMAPWGGHPIFPQLYEDMKHPHKYPLACTISFTMTFIVDFFIAIIGVLMFADTLEDSIIKNFMSSDAYPRSIKITFTVMIGLLPVLKLPLLFKPVISTFVLYFKVNSEKSNPQLVPILIRLGYSIFLLIVSLLVESFGKAVSFLGAAICFTLCITLPFYFKLVIFHDSLEFWNKVGLWTGVAFGIVGAVVGTIGSILT